MDQVREIIAHASEPPRKVDELSDDLRFDTLGIDSLKLMLMVLEIEEKIGRRVFEVGKVSRIETVGELLGLAAS